MTRTQLGGTIVVGVLLGLASPGAGHEKAGAKPPSTTAAAEPAPEAEAPEAYEEERPDAAPLQISVSDALFAHPHNKIVHFPLALGFAGALLILLSYRWPHLLPAARLLLLLAAASAVAAYFTGEAQEEDFEDGSLGVYLERHELMGKISGLTLTLTAALTFVGRARRWLWLLALAVLAVLSFTGMLGGILSHPPA